MSADIPAADMDDLTPAIEQLGANVDLGVRGGVRDAFRLLPAVKARLPSSWSDRHHEGGILRGADQRKGQRITFSQAQPESVGDRSSGRAAATNQGLLQKGSSPADAR